MQTVASSSKHDIEANPFEPIAASDRNQTRTNHANVALRNSNPIMRGVDEEMVGSNWRRKCRSCKCRKSSYCECFSAGVYCIGHCSCKDCLNNGDNEDTVLQARRKNYPKVEVRNENPASKLQKRGCNCNMSWCKNIHSRKDSTAETKSELEETEALLISRTLPSLPYLSMAKPRISFESTPTRSGGAGIRH
ncbi:hypothetical protein L195_g040202 [Trifolium pratense]|uniref:CRC domain-containing protein n=1 Tax=Trifolium pratense TaxID=57577 RepID=A0A2K3M034_TRIPR|nr:hypothetical protein L195_g040202 [Trifolium pratense]